MKNLKILLLALVFVSSNLLSASTEPTKVEPTTTISLEIGKLLKNPSFLVDKDLAAEVKVTVNDNNELVVLSVASDHPELDAFIKSRLNYNKLSVKLSGKKTFVVPVIVTQEE